MTVLDFNDRHRLAVLAIAILDALDGYADTSVIENDPDLSDLYNLASGVDDLVSAWLEPRPPMDDDTVARARRREERVVEARDHVNRLLTAELTRARGETRMGRLRASILNSLQEV